MEYRKCEIIYSNEARESLKGIYRLHLRLVGKNSAQKKTDSIVHTIDLLAEQPYMGTVPRLKRLADDGFRVVVSGNYLCFYEVVGNKVWVADIVDGRTDYPSHLILNKYDSR